MVSGMHSALKVQMTRGTVEFHQIEEAAPMPILMSHKYLSLRCAADRTDVHTWGVQSLTNLILICYSHMCYMCTCSTFTRCLTLECNCAPFFIQLHQYICHQFVEDAAFKPYCTLGMSVSNYQCNQWYIWWRCRCRRKTHKNILKWNQGRKCRDLFHSCEGLEFPNHSLGPPFRLWLRNALAYHQQQWLENSTR